MYRQALWYGFGAYTSWVGVFYLSVVMSRGAPSPHRFGSEIGLVVYAFAMLPVAALWAATLLGWLAIRRRDVPPFGYGFLVPLALGGLHPWVTLGAIILLGNVALLLWEPLVPAVLLVGVALGFGLPVASGELLIRLKIWDDPMDPGPCGPERTNRYLI